MIEEFFLGVIMSLVANAATSGTSYTALPFFQRRKINGRIEEATAEVVEPLLPFLSNEGISEAQQRLLIETCVDELRPYTVDPRPLFDGSLDGQKIFDAKYHASNFPQAIREENLTHVYSLLFPRVATLLCQVPAAVKDWESQAWSENYRRLDIIAADLRRLFERLDSFDKSPSSNRDATLHLARKSLAQRIGIKLDLTGLRSDAPVSGRLRDFFVHPQITTKIGKKDISVDSESDSTSVFLSGKSNALVVGAPGAGKSTWARWLQQEALTDQWMGLVVRCELRGLDAANLPSMHALVRGDITPHISEEISSDLVRKWVNKRLLVILLDGFDEIRPQDRSSVLAWMEDLRLAMEGCPLIVTSRELTTDHLASLSPAWNRWTIQPFDQPRIVSYIGRWYTSTPLLLDGKREVDAVSLAETWGGDPTIGPLTGNPLLLSTLLMVHHLDGSLPSGRSELYRRYAEGMLGLWDDRRNVTAADVPLTVAHKRRILRALAVHLQFAEKDQMDEAEAVEVTGAELESMKLAHDPSAVLATLRERSGLIVGPGLYSFVHKSVSEYFVAEAIIQGDTREPSGKRVDRFRLFERRADDRWNVVTFLWSGFAPITDVESFVEECIKAGAVDLGYGILLDQYDRFANDFRRRCLLSLLAGETACELAVGPHWKVFWGLSWPKDDNRPRLGIPRMDLRGLRGARLGELIEKAVDDGTLTWTDSQGAQYPFRDLLWMSVARSFHDLEDWDACLRTHPPESAPSVAWHFWVANHLMARAMVATDTSLFGFAHRFAELVAGGASYLLVGFMSAVVSEARWDIAHTMPIWESGLGLFLDLSGAGIDSELLASTSSWDLGIKDGIDLLAEFANELNSHRPSPGSANSHVGEVLEIVKYLQSIRKPPIAEQKHPTDA
uniref:NACHT domain-containing protein n=1 Tax=Candidatus Kentrum sp. TUN TaxID=2126343 RepID=A0A450ZPV5_9GAMM|nr:MAG: NACHT domain-containing protein [Candidatus Kentron sp. TUN]VFK55807.1 MAG: NACHT domain-containing protein [Candidatus Kentron sp. TUN]